MYLCQGYQEQESQTVLYAIKSSGLLKTSVLKKAQGIRSIVPKIAGAKEQQSILIANTAVNRSKVISLGLRSFAIWSVAIKVIAIAGERIQALGKVIRQVIQQSISILQLPTVSLKSANNVAQQSQSTGPTKQANTYEIEQIGYNYVGAVTFIMTDLTRHLGDINSMDKA